MRNDIARRVHIETLIFGNGGKVMSADNKTIDVFCDAVAMKEKKVALYGDAMKSCPDKVGVETFRMLKEAEENHLKSLQVAYEDLKVGKADLNACKLHEFGGDDKKADLRKIADEHGKMPKACLDDVVAITTGMKLEEESIKYLSERLKGATDPAEKQVLERLVAEEREHFVMLSDLKFYYEDTENWFLEKGGSRLDGAGEFA